VKTISYDRKTWISVMGDSGNVLGFGFGNGNNTSWDIPIVHFLR